MKIAVELDNNAMQFVQVVEVVGADPVVVLYRDSNGNLVAQKAKRFSSGSVEDG